jgi:hypothetical protein
MSIFNVSFKFDITDLFLIGFVCRFYIIDIDCFRDFFLFLLDFTKFDLFKIFSSWHGCFQRLSWWAKFIICLDFSIFFVWIF